VTSWHPRATPHDPDRTSGPEVRSFVLVGARCEAARLDRRPDPARFPAAGVASGPVECAGECGGAMCRSGGGRDGGDQRLGPGHV